MKVLVLSGPHRAGKDTVAEMVRRTSPSYIAVDSIGRILKERAHAAYNLYDEEDQLRPHWFYEHSKEIPQADFLGLTPRQAYQFIAESFRQRHGLDVWGKMFVREWGTPARGDGLLLVVTGCGNQIEFDTLRALDRNVRVWQVEREGCTFEGDTREPVSCGAAQILENNGTLDELRQSVARLL